MNPGGVLHRAMPTVAGVLIALAICVPVTVLVVSGFNVEVQDEIPTLVATIVALAISGAGVLAWCVHRGMTWQDPSRLSPLWSVLAGRRALLVAYVLIVGAWAALCVVLGMSSWLELLAEGFRPDRTPSSSSLLTNWEDWTWVAVFVATQAAFLWSGGKLRIGTPSPKPYRFAVSAAIFSLAMSILVAGLVLAMLEGVDRMDVRSRPEDSADLGKFILALLIGNWTIWLPIAWFAFRGVDRPTGLSRLSALLLAGSWIEVAVALPIELVARGRHDNCPCASGSWIGLAVGGPLLLWSLGPAVYLLYRRERALNVQKPGHARRLLARRSTKIRATPNVEAT
jgi:hypothetical protein